MVTVKSVLTEEIIEVFRQGALGTLTSMCGEQPVYEAEIEEQPFDGIVSIIFFAGSKSLSMMLGLPEKTATWITTKFSGFEIAYESEDMGDMIGEIANVIAGDISARLRDMDYQNQMSIPSVTKGCLVEILLAQNQPSRTLHFTIAKRPFWLKVTSKVE